MGYVNFKTSCFQKITKNMLHSKGILLHSLRSIYVHENPAQTKSRFNNVVDTFPF